MGGLKRMEEKGGGLGRTSTLKGGSLEKRGVTFFRVRIAIFTKKYIFSVIAKNSNCEILTKNLVTFKK